MQRCTSLRLGSLLFLPALAAAQFLPPGLPLGDNGGEDVFVDHLVQGATVHLVWASNVDHTGTAGADPDIFYARFDGLAWSAPVLVNSYGVNDNASADGEQFPRLAIGPDGVLHCVWQSQNPLQPASDWDVFYASSTGSAWTTAQLMSTFDNDETVPTVITRGTGDPLVVWQLNTAGIDYVRYRSRVGAAWSTEISLDGASGGGDHGPVALARGDDGTIVAAWSTTGYAGSLDADPDIVFSQLPPAGTWSSPVAVSNHAYGDVGADRNPAVAVLDTDNGREIHVVWESTSDVAGNNTEGDLLGTVIPTGAFVPSLQPTYLVNSNAIGDNYADQLPSLCVEPGGVMHVAWQTNDANIGDLDVLHAYNPTPFGLWSDLDLLGLNGFLDIPGENDSRPDLECGALGLLSGAWQSTDDLLGTISGGDHEIFHALGLGWNVSRPEPINPQADSDIGDDHQADLIVDPAGILHAVFSSDEPSLGGAPGSVWNVFYTRNEGSGWTTPEPVSNFGGPAGNNIDARVGVDRQGVVHVVWVGNFNFGGTAGNDLDLFYRRRENASWSSIELVNSTAVGSNEQSDLRGFALAPDGSPHVLWTDCELPCHSHRLLWSRRSATSWSAAEQVDSPVNPSALASVVFPSLRLDAQSAPHVCWSTNANYAGSGFDLDVLYSARVGGSWTTPEHVNESWQSDSATDYQCRLVGVDQGSITALVVSDLDRDGAGSFDDDLFLSRRANAGWQPMTLLLEAARTDSTSESSVQAAQIEDLLVVAWAMTPPGGGAFDVGYAIVPLETLPSPAPVKKANATALVEHSFATDVPTALSISPSGRAYFAWTSTVDRAGTGNSDTDVYHAWVALPIPPLFADGFESGGTAMWSSVTP